MALTPRLPSRVPLPVDLDCAAFAFGLDYAKDTHYEDMLWPQLGYHDHTLNPGSYIRSHTNQHPPAATRLLAAGDPHPR